MIWRGRHTTNDRYRTRLSLSIRYGCSLLVRVRVAIVKPSDEPFRMGETQYTVLRVFVSYIIALGMPDDSNISPLLLTNAMHKTLSIIFL